MNRVHSQWLAVVLMGAAISASALVAHAQRWSQTVVSQDLPHLNGDKLRTEIVAVTYAPGGASPVHSHPCPVIGYVLEGAVRMQVDERPEKVYRAGEAFYEPPNRVHRVSANASTTRPARFLVFFVCDKGAPLSSPIPGGKR